MILPVNNHGINNGTRKFLPVEALSLLSKCVVLDSDEPSYYWHKAEAYLEACNFAMSISFIKVAISKIKQRQAAGNGWRPEENAENQDSYFHHLQQHQQHLLPSHENDDNESQQGFDESSSRLYLETRLAVVMYVYAQCLIDVKRYHEALLLLQEAYELGWELDSILMRM